MSADLNSYYRPAKRKYVESTHVFEARPFQTVPGGIIYGYDVYRNDLHITFMHTEQAAKEFIDKLQHALAGGK